ncbi:hypothetical protein QYM36_010126 [Artemia franciscana]|uniref:Uncharacterized protein n=1 Tax=Artemia franciscana TaxID=6661 RepID=A0AA88HQS9_ARTSF|nr:hypothetical protein QYM36_010126 [Artemia franciscana]
MKLGHPGGFSMKAGFPGGDQPCYTTPSSGKDGGVCLQSDCCEGGLYISNLCPDYASNVRCCYSSNKCTASCGTCSDSVAKDYACKLLALVEQRKITLKHDHFNSLGNNPYDGASALSNVRDTCYGGQGKRSSYSCSEGNTPGGCVCMGRKMLQTLYDYAVSFYNDYSAPITVTSLAGSCHSTTSNHYKGNTWDVACTAPVDHCSRLRDYCLSQSPIEACYPGSSCGGHASWVHCAFQV